MSLPYFFDQHYQAANFSEKLLAPGEYEQCSFDACHFAHTQMQQYQFVDCVFINCDLSLAILSQTALRNVQFKHCKLVGVHFENCNPFLFEVHFEHCNLQLASFEGMKMKQSSFNHCQLLETDFTKADCTKILFAACDCTGIVFVHTNLEQADFRTSFNYTIDPDANRLRKAKFSALGLAGLLTKYQLSIE